MTDDPFPLESTAAAAQAAIAEVIFLLRQLVGTLSVSDRLGTQAPSISRELENGGAPSARLPVHGLDYV